jgi:hypothetical protein
MLLRTITGEVSAGSRQIWILKATLTDAIVWQTGGVKGFESGLVDGDMVVRLECVVGDGRALAVALAKRRDGADLGSDAAGQEKACDGGVEVHLGEAPLMMVLVMLNALRFNWQRPWYLCCVSAPPSTASLDIP